MNKFETDVLILTTVMVVFVSMLVIPAGMSLPTPENTFPWFSVGVRSVADILYDPSWGLFKESSRAYPTQSFWFDDQCKILNMMLEDPQAFGDNITETVNNLHDVYYNGYFPRRYVLTIPSANSMDPNNADFGNGFLSIAGNLTNPHDSSHLLQLSYGEAAGNVTFCSLGGQGVIIVPQDNPYGSYSLDPIEIKADESNNPGFDANATGGSNTDMDLLPWEYNSPINWSYAQNPPNGCVYSTKWAAEPAGYGRCIGLEKWVTSGSAMDWRSDAFGVTSGASYIFQYNYRGAYNSGDAVSVYLRWFYANGTLIDQEFAGYTSNAASWSWSHNSYTAPSGAATADIYIYCGANTIARYYFDNFDFRTSSGSNLVANGDLERVDSNSQFITTSYHSPYRCLLLCNDTYAIQHLVYPQPTSQFAHLYWYSKVGAATSYDVRIYYSDGTSTTITESNNNTDWAEQRIYANRTTAGKTIESIGFFAKGLPQETWIDDVGIVYTPAGASMVASVIQTPDSNIIYGLENYTDTNINLQTSFGFQTNKTYLEENITITSYYANPINAYLRFAFDGLSGKYTGEVHDGVDSRSYFDSIWLSGVGRRTINASQGVNTLFSISDPAYCHWASNYFIAELKNIPEWSGTLGLVAVIDKSHFNAIINSATAEHPDRLNYLTYDMRYDNIVKNNATTLSSKIFCMNGYDWTNPQTYDSFFNTTIRDNIDPGISFHIGTILFGLARFRQVYGYDPFSMAEGTFNCYKHMFTSQGTPFYGTYLVTAGNAILGSLSLYNTTGNYTYLQFANTLGNYLKQIQITNSSDARCGEFPMPHNGVVYLDCHALACAALNNLLTYNSSYSDSYNLGLSVIRYGYRPSGFSRIAGPEGQVSNDIKRIYVYADSTHIDDDYWVYKAGLTARAAIAHNMTLMMLGISRIWYDTAWNSTGIYIFNCENGTEINSETDPWGLYTWKKVAEWELSSFGFYYEFLTGHYAITDFAHDNCSLHTEIYASNRTSTISTLLYNASQGKVYTVSVDGSALSPSLSLSEFELSSNNAYYEEVDKRTLLIKAIPQTSDKTVIDIYFNVIPEFPSLIVLPIFIIATLVTAIICRKKKRLSKLARAF